MGMCALAAVSMEWLLAFLMIKLKPSPQFTLHGQPSSVVYGGLAAVAWPPTGLFRWWGGGRRLAGMAARRGIGVWGS